MASENLYKIMSKDLLKNKYKNYNKHAPQHPARILISGPSGSGKTNLAVNIVHQMGNFDNVIIICKNPDEPMLKFLSIRLKKLKVPCKISIKLSDLPSMNNSTKEKIEKDELDQTLIIFDDMVAESNKVLKLIYPYFSMGRHHGFSTMFITQSFFKTPKFIRDNCTDFFFLKTSDQNDIKNIINRFTGILDKETLLSMYLKATKNKFDFFWISPDHSDDKKKYRSSFS